MTQTERDLLQKGMRLAYLLTQEVCQDKPTHRKVQRGTLHAPSALYEWANDVADLLRTN